MDLPLKLARTIRVLQHQKLLKATNDTELAKLSGLSRKTISKHKANISTYTQSSPVATTQDIKLVNKRILQTYIDEALPTGEIAAILGAIAGFVLRYEMNLLGNVNQRAKIVSIGNAFIRLCVMVLVRKDDKGTPIHNKNKNADYLLTALNKAAFVDKLFKRSPGYKSGAYSKRWSLLPLAMEVVKTSTQSLMTFIQEYQYSSTTEVTYLPDHIPPLICSGESVTRNTAHPPLENCSFLVEYDDLQPLSLRSLLLILSQSSFSPYTNYIAVSLKNLGKTDPSVGRSYNIFTSIRSSERKELGFINYDIGGALQIICFGLLHRYSSDPELFTSFSTIFQYGFDTQYKTDLRQTISDDLDIPLSDVKELLTAYANGGNKSVDKHPSLKSFSDDSDRLRREVISLIAQHEPEVLAIAVSQSKHTFDSKMDWKSTERLDNNTERQKSSVFFFIWTYYEKQIRDAMLTVVPDGLPVHDAIYSRHDVPIASFEVAVKQQTGFEVKISH